MVCERKTTRFNPNTSERGIRTHVFTTAILPAAWTCRDMYRTRDAHQGMVCAYCRCLLAKTLYEVRIQVNTWHHVHPSRLLRSPSGYLLSNVLHDAAQAQC